MLQMGEIIELVRFYEARRSRKEFGPFNPVTVRNGVSARRPRDILRSPLSPLSILSPSLFLFSSLLILFVLHPLFIALSPRLARSDITWRTCMHACMRPPCLHACMHLEARMAQLAVQTGVPLSLFLFVFLSLSLSSFLRFAKERRTAAR